MRGLYRDFYQRGKGFSTEDMIGIVNRLTRRDYHDFYRRHVSGVEAPPYEAILGYAGYRIEKSIEKKSSFGFAAGPPGKPVLPVTSVAPESAAAKAGLRVGDIITKIGGQALPSWDQLRGMHSGAKVILTITRAGEEREILYTVGSREQEIYNLVELPKPTVEQLKIREGWLSMGKKKE